MMYLERSIQRYLGDLASRKSTPGGGSAAALVGATGVSLISMVANFTLGKEKYKVFEEEVKNILSSSESLGRRLIGLIDEDIKSYQKLSSAYKLEKDGGRESLIQERLKDALSAPLEICKCCFKAIKLCPPLVEKGNLNLISDLGIAAVLLESAYQSAFLNVEINLKGIKDKDFVYRIKETLKPSEKEIIVIKDKVLKAVKEKISLK